MGQPAWRIETLDARAGLAFASWRGERSTDWDGTPEEGLVLFVGAPDFRPEPVGNLALALGASRATFQIGLFADGVEISFPTPDALAEFVRRAYVSSRGGDGNDAPGGLIPPPVPPDSPLPAIEVPEHEPFADWHGALQKYQLRATALSAGAAEEIGHVWPSTLDASAPHMFARAGLVVLLEVLRRAPKTADAEFVKWLRLLREFSSQLSRLGVWPILLSASYLPVLTEAIEVLKLPFPEVRVRIKAYMLLFGGPYYDDPDLEQIAYYWRFAYMPPGLEGPSQDVATLLSELPLPTAFRSLAAVDHLESASLFHFMAIVLAAPTAALRGIDSQLALDVLLLCAGCIAARTYGRPPLFAFVHYIEGGNRKATQLEVAAATEAAGEAWDWLKEQLPVEVFSEPLEQVIFGARNLRYGNPPKPGGHRGPPLTPPVTPRSPSPRQRPVLRRRGSR